MQSFIPLTHPLRWRVIEGNGEEHEIKCRLSLRNLFAGEKNRSNLGKIQISMVYNRLRMISVFIRA